MRHLVKFSLLLSLIYLCKAGFPQQGTKDWEWEWAPIGAVWCYETANMGATDSYAQYWYVRSVSDTVYKSANCRKLEVIRHFYPDFEPVKMQDRFTYQDGGDIYFYNADKGEFVLSFSYDLQRGDTVTWQMPMYENCINSFYLDSIFSWEAGFLSGAGMEFTPYNAFMFSNVPIHSYKVVYLSGNYCFAGEIGSDSYSLQHGYGNFFDYFGIWSDIFELSAIPELQTSCMCYYDGSVTINRATFSIYNDTIIYYKDSCRNYYNKFNNISSHTEEKLFKVYPNPFTDFIHIDLPASADNCEIRVFDLMGKLIYSKKTHSNNTPLNLSQLVSGTYLIQIQTKQNIFSKRIVKN